MALPQEGLLTLQQVNIELSKEPEAHITMNDSDVRALAKRPVNESSISFDDLKGRTTGIAEYTIRRGHVNEDLIRMVNRELGDLSKVHIIFEDGITVVNQVFFDQSIANDITKGPYKMSGNTITDLSRFFRGCENMTEIGAELFYGLPKLKFIGSIFMNCPIKQYHSAMFKFNPELKELPPGVLDDNVIVPVDVFEGSAIEVISGNVRNESLDILNPIKNTIREINASIFQGQTIEPTMFADCVNLFSVMKLSGNFEDRKGAFTTGFAGGAWLKADTFKDLAKLNTISSLNVRGYDVGFLNNLPGLLNVHNIDAQQVPNVGRIFDTCPNLNNITKLFGNANVEYTNRTLVSVDEHIFDNCPNVLICSEAFANCVNFTGKVPELWKRSNAPSIIHYDYAKGTINASNYIEIPPDWGGGELPKTQTFTSKEDFDSRIQNLIASGKMKEMSFIFDGDFTQEPNLIRFPVETTETPKMIKTTHTITVNRKEYYYLNIDSMFEDCVNLKYINPSLFSVDEYGKYQFIKTARKTFKNACVDGTEFPTGIFNVVEGLYDVSECFMNSKCTFGTSGPFKEKHHLMKCVSTFENSKINDNLAVFWQGIDGHFQGELEYPQRDLTRMYANTRLILPYALWNGSFINSQGGITYPVICDEMFAETDITDASRVVDSKAASKMESIKGMFKGSKVTKSKDLDMFSIAKYADYMYQNTPITSVGYLNSSTVISLEGIFDNCIQLQSATVDLTEENYTQRYPLNKNANWKFAFRNCNALTKVPNLWDIYKGESNDCFKGCGNASNYSEVPIEWGGTPSFITKTFNTIEEWNTAKADPKFGDNIQNEIHVFGFDDDITYPTNILYTPYQIQGRTNFYRMFYKTNVTTISPDLFKTLFDKEASTYKLYQTFYHCDNLKSIPDNLIDFSNLREYQGSSYITINCRQMFSTYHQNDNIIVNNIIRLDTCKCKAYVDLGYFISHSNIITCKIINKNNNIHLSIHDCCNGCTKLKKLDVDIVSESSNHNSIELYYLNYNCKSLTDLNINVLYNYDGYSDYIKFDTSFLADDCIALENVNINITSTTDKQVRLDTSKMFRRCYNLNNLNINVFNIDNIDVSNSDVTNMFDQCLKLKHIPEIWTLKTEYKLHDAFARYCVDADNFEEVPESYGGPKLIEYTTVEQFSDDLFGYYGGQIYENSVITFNINDPTNYVSFGSMYGSSKYTNTLPLYIKSGPNNNVEFYGLTASPDYNFFFYMKPQNKNFYKNYKSNIMTNLFNKCKITYPNPERYTLNIEVNEDNTVNIDGQNFVKVLVANLFYSKYNNNTGETEQWGDGVPNITLNITSPVTSWDNIYLDLHNMFSDCQEYNNIPINSINFMLYGPQSDIPVYINLSSMFRNCTNLISFDIPLFENINSFNYLNDNRTSAKYMFDGCTNFNTDVTYILDKLNKNFPIDYMFRNCTSLSHIPPAWEMGFTGTHEGYAEGCVNADNYNEVPEGWK